MQRWPLLLAVICFSLCVATFTARIQAAEPQTVAMRVMGLFAPDREADLRAALAELPGVELASLQFDHAEATFRFDPAVAFPESKPADAPKRLGDKLRSASNHTFSLLPLDPSVDKSQLIRVEIGVAGLDCRACSLACYEIIAKIDGVYQATASFKAGKATALIDPNKTNRAAIIAVLKKRNVKTSEASGESE